MPRFFYKKAAWFTCLVFTFFLILPAYSIQADETKNTTEAMKEGEELFNQGEYEKALPLLEKAAKGIRDSEAQGSLYLKMAYAHYKLNDIQKAEESLRNLFEMEVDIQSQAEKFEPEFSMIYKKIKAEYWFSVKSKNEAQKKEDRKIIEKFSRKPDRKTTKLVPILLITGIAITAIVMAVLIWKSDSNVKRGVLLVYNQSNNQVFVKIGSLNRTCSANSSVTINLEVGTHQVEISGEGNTRTYSIVIQENESTVISFSGWD